MLNILRKSENSIAGNLRYIFLFVFLFLMFSVGTTHAATRYWVGSNSNFFSSANWSTTSGGAGGASVPGASDIAIFDGNDNTPCLINANHTVNRLGLLSGYSGQVLVDAGIDFTASTDIQHSSGQFGSTGIKSNIIVNGPYAMSGTAEFLSDSTGVLDVNGNLTIADADMTPPASLEVSGNLSITTGVFTHDSGAVILDGSTSAVLDFNDSFFDLTVSKTAGTLTVSENVTVLDDFSKSNNGTVTFGSSTLDVADLMTLGGGTFNASSGNTNIGGGMSIASIATFNHNNGVFIFDGSANSVINPVSGSVTFNTLNLNKSSATAYIQVGSSTNQTINVDGNLILTNGELRTGDATNEISANGTLTYGSGFDGATTNHANLRIKTTTSVSLPNGAQTVNFIIDDTNQPALDVTTSGSLPVTFQSVTLDTGGARLVNLANVDMIFEGKLTMNASETVFQTGNGTSVIHNASVIVNDGTYSCPVSGPSIAINGVTSELEVSAGAFSCNSATDLYLEGDFDFNGGGFTAPSSANFDIEGNWDVESGAVFTPGGGTVRFVGNNNDKTFNDAAGTSFNNVVLNKDSGQDFTLQTDIDINGDFSISDSGDLVMAGNDVYVAGDWSNDGSAPNAQITPGGGAVILDGTNQAINGSTTFYDLTKVVASEDTLTYEVGSTTTVTNLWTMQGAFQQPLNLVSSSGDADWNIDPQGSRDVDWVDVQRSNNIDGPAIMAANSVDSGNNTNWNFNGIMWWVNDAADNDFENPLNWAGTSGGVGGVGVPGASNAIIFNATSTTDDCEITADAGVLYITTESDYTGIINVLNSSDVTVGNINEDSMTLNGGTISVNEGTFYANGLVTMGASTFNAGMNLVTFNARLTMNDSMSNFNGGTATVNFDEDGLLEALVVNDGVFNASSETMNFGSGITMAAAATFVHNTGSVVMEGTLASVDVDMQNGDAFNDFTINKTDAGDEVSMDTALDIDGDLTLTKGTLTTNNNNMNVGGDWAKIDANATFNGGTSSVTLDGGDQEISGTNTFYNLSKEVIVQNTITFPANTTQTISNLLTLKGAETGYLLIRSSIADEQAIINPTSTDIDYVNVKDSYNSSGTDIDVRESNNKSGLNFGNNTGWLFDTGVIPEFSDYMLMLTGIFGLSLIWRKYGDLSFVNR